MNTSSYPTLPSHPANLRDYNFTDSGNGERLAALFGDSLRFCPELGQWLVWDGRRWKIVAEHVMLHLASEAAKCTYAQAAGNASLTRHAVEFGNLQRLRAAIHHAAVLPPIWGYIEGLDNRPYLLNCANGTLDLRTRDLRAFSRANGMTKVSNVAYDPDARCPQFARFLLEIMSGDEARVEFLRRSVGYALSGRVDEGAAFIFWGPAKSGMNILLAALREVMGEYASEIDAELLNRFARRGARGATWPPEVAALRAIRCVFAGQPASGRFNFASLRYISTAPNAVGRPRSDRAIVRFRPEFKVFSEFNCFPKVNSEFESNRLKIVPFEGTFESGTRDRYLLDALRGEASGILTWAVSGYRAWERDGLGMAPKGRSAAPLSTIDQSFGAFLDECCIVEPGAWLLAVALYERYGRFCRERHERFSPASWCGRTQFSGMMRDAGYKLSRSRRSGNRQLRTWEGLKLSV
jgi:putative DNA primase/helicase